MAPEHILGREKEEARQKNWYDNLFDTPQNRQKRKKLEERLSLKEQIDVPRELEATEDIFYTGSGEAGLTTEFFVLKTLRHYLHVAKGSRLVLNEPMSTEFEIMYNVAGEGNASEVIMTPTDLKKYLQIF